MNRRPLVALHRSTATYTAVAGRSAAGSVNGTGLVPAVDRKSTRLNSSHSSISYAVFCLKKKIKNSLHHAIPPRPTTLSTPHPTHLDAPHDDATTRPARGTSATRKLAARPQPATLVCVFQ